MPAESRPLLELLIRANAAAQNPGEEHEDLAEQFTRIMADPATGEQLRALRAQAEAFCEPAPMPADLAPMFRAVIQAGPATWQVTEAMTAEQHGEAVAQMVRDTAERHGLGDEPRALHWLSVGDDASLAFVGTSPNSPHLARALGGAWNDLVQGAPELLARCAQADAGGEAQ